MIYIDSREGGAQQAEYTAKLITKLRSHRFHPECQLATLTAGDFFFTGRGPKDEAGDETYPSIGFERKTISDFFSSTHSGRLVAEQIPKMLAHYEYRYLIIEGQAKVDWASGELMEMWQGQWMPVARKVKNRGRVSYTGEQLLGAMNTIAVFTPMTVIRTFNIDDTLDVIATLWHWWDKPYDKHSTLKKFHSATQNVVLLEKASFLRRVAKELSGVSWERSSDIEFRFPSVFAMCQAEIDDWLEIPGIGPVLSKRIYNQLRGIDNQ